MNSLIVSHRIYGGEDGESGFQADAYGRRFRDGSSDARATIAGFAPIAARQSFRP
jgi:hypothetical protein